ncbi:pyridoxal phosphate-dependent aminotransferase [Azohydromonas aeria]|uniref:pyridoxal phosphate-dependent aminotransferase n=1 Tax=Azohydromonas aeria TaxID=2590212 RepID=UPI0035C06D8E
MHDFIRSSLAALPASKIREVANAGLGRPDVLAFWFGESDEVTPLEVREAAAASLRRGETFYSHNLGLPELRAALSAYVSDLHAPVDAGRLAITSAGVSALMVAAQLLLNAGDEVVAVVPVWPNITAQPEVLGARVKRVSLHPHLGAWRLDVQELLDAITPATRALLVNAPNNPTGWTLTRAEQQAILDHCRRTGTWIVADEVYERLWWGTGEEGSSAGRAAPSFLDIAAPEDRLVVTQSFSKSFLMTGWRLGWLVLPADPRGQAMEAAGKLLEFNSSCAPVFAQRGALQALALADEFVPGLVSRLKAGRDTLLDGLRTLPGIEVAPPPGGLYAFFRVEGRDDSLALAKRLVAEHGLGLAPGAAFGPEGEGWLRWCFASKDLERLKLGVQRLAGALGL